ncbi:DEHA2F02002p [Debaryomyces hansenii CBS767]|uniref:DEHA2F02002p n=1 Tax=Debaryomyces hansenii (strain ATCC 36239 / CBS 767 / BCRC 21394 / JCM 1990 / NBRC 0083 / IGC 2968) TaxID=284592 RepID=Q6BMW9_DEBHA|nr:DEHA2F02002p [Debaryomyces hansenii CBS767]CAG88758.2 DEHA2F02002p [Debaryomyces hansenii CBS767]|eukprot:XP_460451.2 DEHA2F02002p [Debaryomyces hansenii CBS767]
MSVRKSHLMGKNHIRYYCNYYEMKAKETGIWDPLDSMYEINLSYLNKGAPGASNEGNTSSSKGDFSLPPPPSLTNYPNPPPSAFRNTEEYQQSVTEHTQNQETY